MSNAPTVERSHPNDGLTAGQVERLPGGFEQIGGAAAAQMRALLAGIEVGTTVVVGPGYTGIHCGGCGQLIDVADAARVTTLCRTCMYGPIAGPAMSATATLIVVIDGWDSAQGIVYGAIANERVGVREWNARPAHLIPRLLPVAESLTKGMDARIVAGGYVRVGDWTRHGPLNYTATIEAHPQRCTTCVNGCDCEQGKPGCGHAHCWGVVPDKLYNSCPGVAAVRVEVAAGDAR